MQKIEQSPSIGTRTRTQGYSQELQFVPFNQDFLNDRCMDPVVDQCCSVSATEQGSKQEVCNYFCSKRNEHQDSGITFEHPMTTGSDDSDH